MNTDILVEGLPAIKINRKEYLIYAPYKNVFIELTKTQLSDVAKMSELREIGLFDFPKVAIPKEKSIKIVLNITNKCNLLCKYCWAKSSPSSKEVMSPKTAKKIVNKLSNSHLIDRIHFLGGEPTLNFKAIEAVVSHFVENEISPLPIFYITSNGVIARDKLDWLIKNKFVFSIAWDGIGKAHNDQRPLHENGKSEIIVRRTILRILHEKSSLLRVRMTISKVNLPYLYKSVDWLADNGVKYIHIEPVSPDGRGIEYARKYSVNPGEFVDEFFRVVNLAEKKQVWIMNSNLANLYAPRNYYCSALKHKVYNFNPDGSISHCYKVQNYHDPLAEKFIIGEYDDKCGVIKINRYKSNNLSALNISDNNDYKDFYLKNIYAGGCPYRSNIRQSTAIINNTGDISNKLLRRAILHIYKRAINGQNSVLEGYLHFYGMIEGNNAGKNRKKRTNESMRLMDILEKEKMKIIPILLTSKNQYIGIDACDICI
ncbi:MAG: radical SAM protein [Candidatus Aminicenantes bacterium]|nr:radical SAM protein [Candidatus Aminicenantes bacterium]